MSENEPSLLEEVEVEIPKDEPEPEKVETPEPEAKEPEPEKKEEKPEPSPWEVKYRNTQKALKEERARIRELEAARNAELENIKRELEDYRRAKQSEKENRAFQDNPAEYLKTRLEETEKRLTETAEEAAKRERAELEQRQFIQTVKTAVHDFSREHKDYQEAYNFVRQSRFKEYESMGYDEGDFENLFEQESLGVAGTAFQRGDNPAQIIYNLAMTRGYKSPALEDAAGKLEKLEQAHKKNQTLKGAAASSSFIKRLEDMSDEEFDKYWDTEVKPSRIR